MRKSTLTQANEANILSRSEWWIIAVMISLFAALALCNGWLVDDAYITFRVSDNIVHGYGPRWNISERVQVYTHPLWMLLFTFAHFITREIYYTAIILSWAISTACAGLVALKLASNFRGAIFVLCAMILSKAFMDYSSSGLENPLTHLLIVAFSCIFFGLRESPRKVLFLTCTTSLAIINRHDSILLLAPALAYTIWFSRSWRTLSALILGGAPLLAWEIFSLVYYGFLVPNTAWAKLNTGLPQQVMYRTAANYFIQSAIYDHITLLIIAFAVPYSFVIRQRGIWVLGIGILMHMIYVVRIGGDFMSGRFFSAPFLAALIILGQGNWGSLSRRSWILVLFVVCLAGATIRFPTFVVSPRSGYAEESEHFNMYRNVKDERAYYYRDTGFLAGLGKSRWPDTSWRSMGENLKDSDTKVLSFYAIGFLGYYAGPEVHVLDVMALGDPILSRLQYYGTERQSKSRYIETHSDFMPGHLQRATPNGYAETLESGVNVIEDPWLREYYESLSLVTKGPIWTRARWKAIWKHNTGGLDELLDRYENPSKYGLAAK